jgi:ribosomal protein L36
MKTVTAIRRLKRRAKCGQVVKRRGYLFLLSPYPRFRVRQGRAKVKRGK